MGSHYTIYQWMVKDLALRGNMLILYALIYAASNQGTEQCYISIRVFMERTGLSKPTVSKNLQELIRKNLISKSTDYSSGSASCCYKTIKI